MLPGFIGVYNAGQSAFQMGDNLNLFDFVTVKNVVHAHLLAAERLDAPPLPLTTLDNRLPAIACTVQRRALPTSKHPEPIDPANPPPSNDPPFPSSRNRWNQFFRPPTDAEDSSAPDSDLTLAGQAVFITNGEPIAFWSFARAVYHAYSARPPRWYEPVALPSGVGMLFATLSEWAGRVQGRRPDECGVNRAYMAYVLRDMYFDIERVRRARSLLSRGQTPRPDERTKEVGRAAEPRLGRRHEDCWATSRSSRWKKASAPASRCARSGPL